MQQSIDPLALGAALAQQIKSAVEPLLARIAALEAREPQRGEPGEKGEPGKDGEPGKNGADGLSVSCAFVQKDGHLILVQSDGQTKDMGPISGRDGVDGKDGRDGKDGESLAIVAREYDANAHEIVERYISGGEVKELRYPAGGIVHRGYWGEGKSARAGDAYTHNGCLWIAQRATESEPTPANDAWCIGARKGRDGKDYREAKNDPVSLK